MPNKLLSCSRLDSCLMKTYFKGKNFGPVVLTDPAELKVMDDGKDERRKRH